MGPLPIQIFLRETQANASAVLAWGLSSTLGAQASSLNRCEETVLFSAAKTAAQSPALSTKRLKAPKGQPLFLTLEATAGAVVFVLCVSLPNPPWVRLPCVIPDSI